ncbi:MAG TPA: hypothetical protein PK404_05115 [Fervidobacterium sp.]|nr:hypothetical protein [Fervidobacterium sp.]HOM74594.1 hypothetical protein [Fervidobacterium sp.]HPP18170.1 hypothetical protein [Fervidobacterium sp.]HRD20180.1 hypothetical protein [Fervidobacterium sp.]
MYHPLTEVEVFLQENDKGIETLFKNATKAHKFVNVIATIGTTNWRHSRRGCVFT